MEIQWITVISMLLQYTRNTGANPFLRPLDENQRSSNTHSGSFQSSSDWKSREPILQPYHGKIDYSEEPRDRSRLLERNTPYEGNPKKLSRSTSEKSSSFLSPVNPLDAAANGNRPFNGVQTGVGSSNKGSSLLQPSNSNSRPMTSHAHNTFPKPGENPKPETHGFLTPANQPHNSNSPNNQPQNSNLPINQPQNSNSYINQQQNLNSFDTTNKDFNKQPISDMNHFSVATATQHNEHIYVPEVGASSTQVNTGFIHTMSETATHNPDKFYNQYTSHSSNRLPTGSFFTSTLATNPRRPSGQPPDSSSLLLSPSSPKTTDLNTNKDNPQSQSRPPQSDHSKFQELDDSKSANQEDGNNSSGLVCMWSILVIMNTLNIMYF